MTDSGLHRGTLHRQLAKAQPKAVTWDLLLFYLLLFSLQNRVQESLEDGVRLPSLDIEMLREENTTLKEEQQRHKKVLVLFR